MPDGRTEAAAKAQFEDQSPYHWDDDDLAEDIRETWRQEAAVVLAAADGWDREHRWVRIQLDPDETEVGTEDHMGAVIERLLLPAERIALTVAVAQVGRGEQPTPNVTAACVLALARLAAVGAQGEAQ
jgi:hypothetical protein